MVFNSGDTEKTLSFQAVDDSVDDDGESVQLSLGTLPTGVTEGTHDSTVVSITDDDDPAVTASFEQGTYSVAEGDTVSVKVVLSADPERTVTVPILAADQNGATAADYSVPAQVVFQSGDTEKTLSFAGGRRLRGRRRRVGSALARHPSHRGHRGNTRLDRGVHHR